MYSPAVAAAFSILLTGRICSRAIVRFPDLDSGCDLFGGLTHPMFISHPLRGS